MGVDMNNKIKIGIIICDRYVRCAGGKCFRAMRNREGAFSQYKGEEVELVGYTTCGGCPGGNIEGSIEEMKKNGVNKIHLATGMIVGYPPCQYIEYFHDFIEGIYGIDVVYGTHPIPQKYLEKHRFLGVRENIDWNEIVHPIRANEKTRISYN